MAVLTVVVPLVIAKAPNKSDLYLYQGAVVSTETLLDGEADRLVAEDLAAIVPDAEPEVEAAVVIPEGDPSDTWNVKQIEAYAAANGVDLSGASKKDEKLALIAQHSK